MIADAEAHASDDAAALDKARARNDLEGACYSARSTLSKHASDVDVSAAQAEVDDALKWLNENNDADADAVRKRQQAFDAVVHPVIASCYEAHKQEDDDDGDDPSDDKFFDGDKQVSFSYVTLACEARDDRRFVVFLERGARGLDRRRRRLIFPRRSISIGQFQCKSYLARDPDHPVAVVAAGEGDEQTEEEGNTGNQVPTIQAHPQDRDQMKEGAGEEDATRPPVWKSNFTAVFVLTRRVYLHA